MNIPLPSLNKLLLPLCFLVMLLCPAVSVASNQQITRLCVVSAILLLVKKNHDFKLESHHWIFIAWIVWTIICGIFSEYPEQSFYGYLPYRVEGVITWLIITCFGIMYWKVYNNIRPLAFTCLLCILTVSVGYYFIVHRWPGHFSEYKYAWNYYQMFFIPEVAIGSFAATSAPLLAVFFPILPVIGFIPCYLVASRAGLASVFIWSSFPLYSYFKAHMTINRLLRMMVTIALILLLSPLWVRLFHVEDKLKHMPNLNSTQAGARSQWQLQALWLSSRLPLTGYGLDSLSNYLDAPKGSELTNVGRFITDRTHSIVWDVILMTGWIGFGILLICFLMICQTVHNFPSEQNLICFCVISSFLFFSLMNPAGLMAEIVVVIALFGIRKTL